MAGKGAEVVRMVVSLADAVSGNGVIVLVSNSSLEANFVLTLVVVACRVVPLAFLVGNVCFVENTVWVI